VELFAHQLVGGINDDRSGALFHVGAASAHVGACDSEIFHHDRLVSQFGVHHCVGSNSAWKFGAGVGTNK